MRPEGRRSSDRGAQSPQKVPPRCCSSSGSGKLAKLFRRWKTAVRARFDSVLGHVAQSQSVKQRKQKRHRPGVQFGCGFERARGRGQIGGFLHEDRARIDPRYDAMDGDTEARREVQKSVNRRDRSAMVRQQAGVNVYRAQRQAGDGLLRQYLVAVKGQNDISPTGAQPLMEGRGVHVGDDFHRYTTIRTEGAHRRLSRRSPMKGQETRKLRQGKICDHVRQQARSGVPEQPQRLTDQTTLLRPIGVGQPHKGHSVRILRHKPPHRRGGGERLQRQQGDAHRTDVRTGACLRFATAKNGVRSSEIVLDIHMIISSAGKSMPKSSHRFGSADSAPTCIVITGASSGLGAGLARAYAAPGRRLGLIGRDVSRLDAVAAACRAGGATVEIASLDLGDAVATGAWLRQFDAASPINLLIANAAVSSGTRPDGQPEGIDAACEVVRTNLLGVIHCVEPLLPRMLNRGRGQIAVVGSVAAYRGLPDSPSYCASKAGVMAYGELLRGALDSRGVRVSVIVPGFFESPMSSRYAGRKLFLMTEPEAVARVVHGLDAGARRIVFPRRLAVLLIIAGLLPAWCGDKITRAFSFRIAPSDAERMATAGEP